MLKFLLFILSIAINQFYIKTANWINQNKLIIKLIGRTKVNLGINRFLVNLNGKLKNRR